MRRDANGTRTVSGPQGVDCDGLLAELNREFVLLDGRTFQSFIDVKALDRGRAFSGLLGLSRYSTLRQQLQSISNTRAFNSQFDTSAHATTKATAERIAQKARQANAVDFEELVKSPYDPSVSHDDAKAQCVAALERIPLLKDHCAGKDLSAVDVDECLADVKLAEGGAKRARLTEVIQQQGALERAAALVPDEANVASLGKLTADREQALSSTSGDLAYDLYRASESVMLAGSWPSPTLCPTCEKDDGTSVLQTVQQKLALYQAVELATEALAREWVEKGWTSLADIEASILQTDETPIIKSVSKNAEAGLLSTGDARAVATRIVAVRSRVEAQIRVLVAERTTLEQELPPSMVTVTTAIEVARRLQRSWTELLDAEKTIQTETERANAVSRIKTFLDAASANFAEAESEMAAERLKKVQPLCQSIFKDIMFSPIVPTLLKQGTSEDLGIRLAEFWELKNLSAQALLSESFRNAFAVSVYLAAAQLYGGAPRFIVLDDITSSFDAGHQHHLVEIIRTRFARPAVPDGPQVIFLSHDTLLEKLFNKHSSASAWSHQRLEGTARTAVLAQSGAVNKVRDTTLDLLNAGRVDDAAPRIRQYLEYILHTVIDRCRIPVPLDLAFGDDKRTPGEYLKAVESAVTLCQRAGVLVLEQAQVQNLALHSTTIVSNFLSHWSSGQTQAFSAPALLGVMKAIDDFEKCFKYEPTPGAPLQFYKSLTSR